jgi:ABC-2 type transport system ATP-binding protein
VKVSTEVVRVEGVTKRFTVRKQKTLKENIVQARQGRLYTERFTALSDINFSIESGTSIGLAGPNGSGKSTLLKIIGGILAADEGSVQVRGRVAALLELGAGFHPDLSGRENVYLNAAILGLSTEETDACFADIVDFSGISEFIDTPVKFYSSGMYVRLAFSVAIHVDPDILLVDEVLAVGDEAFQKKCMSKIREFQEDGRTIILVSHSAGQIMDICDRAIVLEEGKMISDDVPEVSMGLLIKHYQDFMAAQAEQQAIDAPAAQATISGAALAKRGTPLQRGTVTADLAVGDTLDIEWDVNFLEEVPGWHWALDVEKTIGGRALQVKSQDLAMALPVQHGAVRVRATLPNVAFGQGNYRVNVSIYDADARLIADLTPAGEFSVASAGRSEGIVYVDASAEVL